MLISDILKIFEEFGDLQVFDTQKLAQKEITVSYYDMRDARHAFDALSLIYAVSYLQDPLEIEFIDFVVLDDNSNSNAHFVNKVLGPESMQILHVENYWVVKYYDRRRVWQVQSALLDRGIKARNLKVSPAALKREEKEQPSPIDINFIEKEPLKPIDLNLKPPSPKHHSVIPKRKFETENKGNYVISLNLVLSHIDCRTTIMIKNIPNKYTQAMLIQAIDFHHPGCYDFLYLPIDFKNKCNVGYSFINFVDHRFIPAFYQEFDGKTWERFNSSKICALSYARIQGRAALEKHFQSSSIMIQDDTSMKPIILS